MGGGENEQMGVGQDLVCFDVEKDYGGQEDEVINFGHTVRKKQHGKKTDTGEYGRQAVMGQTSKDL